MPKKQTDGRYRTKIKVGDRPDGKSVFKYASGRTKKELTQNIEELKKKYVGGAEVHRDIMFGEYAIQWYKAYVYPGISPSSRDCYETFLNRHILPVFMDRQIRAIQATDLQIFMNGKAGMGVSSLGYMQSILTGVFRHAAAHGIIDRNPAQDLKKPTAKKISRRCLTPEETTAALKVGNSHPEGLLLLILYYTGVRLGEALGLQWRDIDFTKRELHIRRDIDFKTNQIGTVKSQASLRSIPMPDELCAALSAVRGIGETFVLQAPDTHGHLPQSTFKRRWERLMRAMVKANNSIEHTDDADHSIESEDGASILTAHYFRHNYASIIYDADVDILSAQRFLGHSDFKTTLSIYTHLSKGKQDKNAEKARLAFSGKIKVAEKLPGE